MINTSLKAINYTPSSTAKKVKIGYSCTRNIEQIISTHNRKILNDKKTTTNVKSCNCRKPKLCPVENDCLAKNVVYQATLPSKATYIGSTSTTFKTRYNNHTHSFRSVHKQNATKLSQYVWNKGLGPKPPIDWQIIRRCCLYQPGHKTCNLCTTEKLLLIQNSSDSSNLNSRSDLANRCPHRKEFLLSHRAPNRTID